MLWFIGKRGGNPAVGTAFQNILCYGLSGIKGVFAGDGRISKHLMLWFIHNTLDLLEQACSISKHLMLWFIGHWSNSET